MNARSRTVMATVSIVALAATWTVFNGARLWTAAHRKATVSRGSIAVSALEAIPGNIVGSPNARLAVHVFSDYRCPVCRELWLRSERILRSRTDVSFVIHPLPRPGDGLSLELAMAAECAGRQGAFRQAHDYLFSRNDDLGTSAPDSRPTPPGLRSLQGYSACLQDSSVFAAVSRNGDIPQRVGARFTPILVIGQDVYDGLPWDFERLIVAHLATGAQATRTPPS